MPRYLGIDFGHKRLGLAVSDAEGRLATPLKQLDRAGSAERDARQIRQIVDDYEVEAIVVGLPLNMDGTVGEQAERAADYAQALANALELPVELWDERLTSHAADRMLDERDELTRKKRKARRDALAAQAILQGFLDSRRQC